MNRRRSNSLAGSPLLIGAIATLIVAVAVFITYNANNGLPFTPTYNIKVQLPEASGLLRGNQVRIGGTRVGTVSSLTPYQDPKTGRVTAIVSLKIEKSASPLPVDTKAIVQLVSDIGLKFLALERGHSTQMLKAGQTIPLAQTSEPVDIDQFFGMFDKKTRAANQVNLTTFGNGLAGRGIGLNETFATLRPLVTAAIPVLRNLSSPQTGFGQLFVALDRAAKEVAPVASQQAELYSNLDTVFTAWASVAPSLEKTIEGGPPALRQGAYSLAFEAEFDDKSAEFMRLLRPSASILRTLAAPLGHAFSVGAVNVRAATGLAPEVRESSQALAQFAHNPIVVEGLEQATRTLGYGNPLLAGLAPAQTGCNYLTLAFRNLASLLSESIGVGTVGRAAAVLAPDGLNNEGVSASAPANGPSVDHAAPEVKPGPGGTPIKVAGPAVDNNRLHYNPYPNVGASGQPDVCEAGNETYAPNTAVIGPQSTSAGKNHEETKREDDLFGEKYPQATLEALGLAKGKKK